MSTTPMSPMSAGPAAAPPPAQQRRVRHQARDAVSVMVVSVAMSAGSALGLLLLSRLGQQG